MISIDLHELIYIIPDIIKLFLAGYIFMSLFNWLTNTKMDSYVVAVWSLIVNTLITAFYTTLHNYFFITTDFNESFKILIYVLTAFVLSFIIAKIKECSYIKRLLQKIYHKSIYDSVFKAIIDYDKRTCMYIYLKESNVVYAGVFKYIEEKENDSYLVLINYTSYTTDTFDAILNTEENNLKMSVAINLQDIERIELLYEDDSEIWKWLNENNSEKKSSKKNKRKKKNNKK